MDKRVDISVVVPVYNVEKYLEECLDSILMQKKVSYEIICVNDGSTDASLKILEKYEKNNQNVRIYTKPNEGLSSARNYGIERALGEYIYCLDSDDMLYGEEDLAFMVTEMEKKALDILYFDGNTIFENDVLKEKHIFFDGCYKRKKAYGIFEKGYQLLIELEENKDYFVNANLQCLRKSFIERTGLRYPDGLIYEDNLYKFESLLLAGRVAHWNKTIYVHRVRDNSITTEGNTYKNFYNYFHIYKRMLECWKQSDNAIEVSQVATSIIERLARTTSLLYQKLSYQEKMLKDFSPTDIFELQLLSRVYSQEENNSYVFPYHFFKQDSKVLIYGAGNVGKKLYEKALKDKYVNIIGIVDINAEAISWKYPIDRVDIIEEKEYDFILISVENKKIYEEIRNLLVEKMVPENKIVWFGKMTRKERYYEFLYDMFSSNDKFEELSRGVL